MRFRFSDRRPIVEMLTAEALREFALRVTSNSAERIPNQAVERFNLRSSWPHHGRPEDMPARSGLRVHLKSPQL